ncbi:MULTISPECIES: hypothetical protein [unclassified Ruegeria]|uniref:hypothetical protein n=1 Tax=unclassified Ruegeria TaxID=2625375 RepID=UPI001487769E|nr:MULTISPECIES: hypothetical protein [unclassified Ruegeria]NOD33796.1 hypothetical protein [Ruegeria sp. HKCCD7296]NOD45887.1 hypothetical protein [Ruegeria sp. HKCCD5849]NOD50813.1 hypothetical protein [Ruegeria sp. HKCCD5851]NOD63665.1 hypothetical protein [Ruegeria sp. HKCCD6109]NOD67620.1 hypothetical protein [Ruegeria sp. HKCCD7303]
MTAIEMTGRLPIWQRLFFAIPVFGWLARDAVNGKAEDLYYTAGAIFSMWGCSIMLFGLPGLFIPALMMVPVMFLILVLISRG